MTSPPTDRVRLVSRVIIKGRIEDLWREITKTATAVEIGFGAKALPTHARLKVMPPNSMCRFTTRIGSVAEVDAELTAWIRQAYGEAG